MSLTKELSIVPAASPCTRVLAIHAPYPGRLMFYAEPTSLLYALAPLASSLAAQGRLDELGLLDPGCSSEAFYGELEELLSIAPVRIVCVSASTAAIEEAARVVETVRTTLGQGVLVVLGGPHEDGCQEKAATRIEGVDLSVSGRSGEFLRELVEGFLAVERRPQAWCEEVGWRMRPEGGPEVLATSPWWGRPASRMLRSSGDVPQAGLGWRPLAPRRARFEVFEAETALPVMVSRGCSYGRCSFCAEATLGRQELSWEAVEWLELAMGAAPGAAVYFQDSIFPGPGRFRSSLLGALRESGVEWGCQVYLPMLSRQNAEELAAGGCSYVYTGLESGAPSIASSLGKPGLGPELALERFGWLADLGLRVGISLMFGTLDQRGRLSEGAGQVAQTVELARAIRCRGVDVVGFYCNIETVLPGTHLERGLRSAGLELDFYRQPRCELFEGMEDGSVGYNFMTLPGGEVSAGVAMRHAQAILSGIEAIQAM